ncbi:MAG TPA: VOC family protein [Pyrinomonadaceae bacterium]|nr:VOC family protein [Pyrinomonadaceae bacterium]
MIGVKPYIGFSGNCEEAFNFYKECMNASIEGMLRYGDSPMAGNGNADKIMHAVLRIGDTIIMAGDSIHEEHPVTMGNNISMALGVDTAEEAETMFAKMAEGGQVTMPLQETFWASRFGMLQDKFGINWMFNCEKSHGSMQEG